MEEVDSSTWSDLKFRRVQHYGYEFDYIVNNVDKSKPLGSAWPPICERLMSGKLEVVTKEAHVSMPDQLTINEYEPGQGIPPHIDTHSAFEDGLMSLRYMLRISLSNCLFLYKAS